MYHPLALLVVRLQQAFAWQLASAARTMIADLSPWRKGKTDEPRNSLCFHRFNIRRTSQRCVCLHGIHISVAREKPLISLLRLYLVQALSNVSLGTKGARN
jgi:hypothetical protein